MPSILTSSGEHTDGGVHTDGNVHTDGGIHTDGYSRYGGYIQKVLNYGPIAYWPLNETSGTVARCMVDSAQNGQYQGVTLADGIAPDGSPCPLFDGLNDYVNIYTVTFRDALNGSEGSVAGWARAFNAGVWTDGAYRWLYRLEVNANNYIDHLKYNVNNQVASVYRSGGVISQRIVNPWNPTAFYHYGATWSASADEFRMYLNGVQQGATINGLGVWAGLLGANTAVIGAVNITPNSVWHGWEAHVAVWNRALPPAEMANLAAA